MNRIEDGDQVVLCGLVQLRSVLFLETGIRQAQLLRLGLAGRDSLAGEVVAGEAAVRECFGHQVYGVALPAANVRNIDTRLQPLDEARHEGQGNVDESGVEYLGALFGHHPLECGVGGIRDAAALPEALDDLVLDVPHERCELKERC